MGKDYKQLNIGTVDFMVSAKNRAIQISNFNHVKSVSVLMGNCCKVFFKEGYIFHEYRPNKENNLKHDLIIRKPIIS